MNAVKANHLVWLDLEMTGLDPEKNKIIEIATIITDKDLNILEEGPNLIIHQPEDILRKMDNWNRRQHKKSGLADAVRKSKLSVKQAERQTLAFIKKYCPPQTAPLCGNSIHHDRSFLARHMPKIHRYLHYRHIDVSTVKMLVRSWFPKTKAFSKTSDDHRALADIQDSIEELRYYRQNFFPGHS